MPSSPFLRRGTVAAVLLLLAGGCGGGGTSPLATVKGKVLYRGRPLPTGTIVFAPDSVRGNHGPLARAAIQPDGSYALQTDDVPGAAPGWYRVTVIALDATAATSGQSFAVPHSLLPDKYRDPQLSGLSCEVKPERVNGINFNLE
jgi:hypothetical protein